MVLSRGAQRLRVLGTGSDFGGGAYSVHQISSPLHFQHLPNSFHSQAHLPFIALQGGPVKHFFIWIGNGPVSDSMIST